jgi:hypothetical protein
LAVLIAETPELEPARNRLLASLARAADQVNLAALRLEEGDVAKAAQALKRASKRVRAMQHVLRSLRTRQLVPIGVRLSVLDEVTDVAERARALHAAVRALARGGTLRR